MRLNVSGLLFIVLLGVVGFFVTAPWWAFRSMRDAARTGDVPALAQLVDYNAVRQSMSAQLSGRPPAEAPPPDMLHDPIGAITSMFKPSAPATPEVERYISASALAALADGRPPNAPLAPGAREPFPMIAFWGPDRCRITVADPSLASRKTEFTFQRRGIFTWKLVRIVLPGRAPPAAPAAAPAAAP